MENKMSVVKEEIKKAVKGKDEVVEKVLAAMLAGGHILLEDIPGVGKTTLAMSIAKSMSLSYKRVQFTPDVLPSDIVGFSMYNQDTKSFEYQQGAVYCNLFLADEINRTSPKTQSALLEVMEEGNVTVDGVTRSLPSPFTVIATENPLGSSGTQMLPESQLDRFMVCLSMGYPKHDAAVDILRDNAKKPLSLLQNVISTDEFEALRQKANDMYVHDSIYDYIVTLVEKTRTSQLFAMGASPRGSIALLRMAKAMAVLSGRDYVTPEDISSVFFDVLGHRVKLSTKARAEGKDVKDALEELFAEVKVPRT
ncbi:MAG: MoxR family ATPase [Lachnospiraceae bacterium]|nr:MoxR family ATPase [Lachnospiraceae bacterium]